MVKGAIVNTAVPLSDGGHEVRAMGAYWATAVNSCPTTV